MTLCLCVSAHLVNKCPFHGRFSAECYCILCAFLLVILLFKMASGTSLVVQRLRFCASTAGGMGSIPGGGTKIPHVGQHGQKKKKQNTN